MAPHQNFRVLSPLGEATVNGFKNIRCISLLVWLRSPPTPLSSPWALK